MSTSHPEATGQPAPRVTRGGGVVRPELTDAAVVSRSWGMATATLVSRITGFARIVLLAAILGAALTSAFSVANQLPNQIAALVLEATFTAIFVPVLARAERDDADGGEAFVRRLVTLATTVLLIATILSLSATPVLVRLMLGGDPQVNEALTRAFAYLLIPQVLFYGLSSVFMAILNNRNIFGPPAWAPVVNNVVAIVTLVVYVLVPGELSVDPVRMGNAKLLVLGTGTTLGVVAQAAVLFAAIRRERINLRPLWGIDDRLKKFGAMAAAMVLYVLISQIGFVVTNQIAATAAASGPAIYNYTWLLLQLPFGIIGVTVLTVVTPRLSRNAAAGDTEAVLGDISLATRLTMITLIPVVALMTVGGPAIGSALFAYGNFGATDAGYLGAAVTLSAFTLIPYQLVLLQLRVFYARQEPWTPILIVIVITVVKIVGSVLAPHLTGVPDLVAGYLGTANGLGFTAGAVVGHALLRRSLRPPSGRLIGPEVIQTVLVTITASLLAALVAVVLDRILGLPALIDGGGAGSLLRLVLLGAVMIPIMIAVLVRAKVPEAQAGLTAVRRRLPGRLRGAPYAGGYADPAGQTGPAGPPSQTSQTDASGDRPAAPSKPAPDPAGDGKSKGSDVPDEPRPAARAAPGSEPAAKRATPGLRDRESGAAAGPAPVLSHIDEHLPATADLKAGVVVADGRYRLLVPHGGSPVLQFWQALDTRTDRQVALTFVDPDLTMPEPKRAAILARTLRLRRIHLAGLATVLDVIESPTAGLVVSEWVRGASLPEVARTAPSPVGAARATRALAAAAAAAHDAGVALSVDHPGRIRVSVAGDVTLAFPATMPDARPADDIRGIGACLYALLVDRWPLAESATHSGMRPADRDAAGQPVNPELVDRSIPFPIAASAVHAIGQSGGIRTASTLLNLLQQTSPTTDRTEQLLPVEDSFAASPRHTANHRKAVLIAVGLAVAILAAGMMALSSLLDQIFGNVGPLKSDELGLNNPSALSSAPPGSVGRPITPAGVSVFSPDGGPDHPDDAVLAIDGDQATAWSTDTYQDRQPFPNFKSGVGLMLKLPEPTEVGAVGLDLSSNGTKVEIRSAKNPYPASIDDTELLAAPKALHPGNNRIVVDGAGHPTSYLLIWIAKLGTTGSESRAAISEVTVNAVS